MKNLTTTFFLLLIITYGYSQTPCENNMAGSYPCNDYDLLSYISLAEMDAATGNDSWGWTDPITNKEYALMGLNNGLAFIDISNPISPVYLGKLPTTRYSSSWRDIKVYNNHAYIVADFARDHGMQIFDLTRLRTATNPPLIFNPDNTFNQIGSAHNIVINEDSGYAYIVGCKDHGYNGEPIFVNIQDPKNPVIEGTFVSTGGDIYAHDAQVVTYNGPDTDYKGREILIGSNQLEVVIADVTDKSNPKTISTIQYTDVKYTHQGWFTEDMRYFLLGDELDEMGIGFNTKTIIFDFEDLDNPKEHMIYNGPTPAIDHNGYVKGDKFYLANYRAGVRVIDISDIANKNITEVGYFDTYPADSAADWGGVWNVYPYFESGNILVSDNSTGFYLIRKSNSSLGTNDFSSKEKSFISIFPNPAKSGSKLTITSGKGIELQKLEIYNVLGKKVAVIKSFDSPEKTSISLNYSPGIYMIRINDNITRKLIIN